MLILSTHLSLSLHTHMHTFMLPICEILHKTRALLLLQYAAFVVGNHCCCCRKPLWSAIRSKAIHKMINNTAMLSPASAPSSANTAPTSQLHWAYLRLLPRLHDVRAIVNLSRQPGSVAGSSSNARLRPLFRVLQFEQVIYTVC